MINLNDFRKNIYQNEGFKECPHYSEDGVILKIFESIGVGRKPLIVEFGETRSLGTTTRSFRIKYKSKAIYFTGNISLKSNILNILDVLKITVRKRNPAFLKFLFNMPFQFFVTPDNIVELLQKKVEGEIDILTIDIDSYDFFIAKKILENNFRPRLLILEYNFNLGRNVKISYPFTLEPIVTNTKRAFGASFEAMKSLAEQYGYKLVHISGFCNLFFIRHDYSDLFETPDIESEIIHNDRDVLTFIDKYCQKGFIPSWFNSPLVTDKDIEHFQKV